MRHSIKTYWENNMKIIDRLNEDKIHISFEVFPPKTDAGFDKVLDATDKIAALKPSYISVTYEQAAEPVRIRQGSLLILRKTWVY